MNQSDYLNIILDGYFNHHEYLADHFYRECKKAEKEHIDFAEFFQRLINANKVFDNDINTRYYDRLNTWYLAKEQYESEGKWLEEYETSKPEKNNFTAHLMSITRGQYLGHLGWGDLAFISQSIGIAIEKYKTLDLKSDASINSDPLGIESHNKEQILFAAKPIFKPEAIQPVFDLIKDFFHVEHQNVLKQILETGNDASEPLIFLDNGNRLADSFKQLIKADIITGCEQRELENWIRKNFKYRFRQEIKSFTPRYLNDIISTNKDLCQNPILNVKTESTTGKILISKA